MSKKVDINTLFKCRSPSHSPPKPSNQLEQFEPNNPQNSPTIADKKRRLSDIQNELTNFDENDLFGYEGLEINQQNSDFVPFPKKIKTSEELIQISDDDQSDDIKDTSISQASSDLHLKPSFASFDSNDSFSDSSLPIKPPLPKFTEIEDIETMKDRLIQQNRIVDGFRMSNHFNELESHSFSDFDSGVNLPSSDHTLGHNNTHIAPNLSMSNPTTLKRSISSPQPQNSSFEPSLVKHHTIGSLSSDLKSHNDYDIIHAHSEESTKHFEALKSNLSNAQHKIFISFLSSGEGPGKEFSSYRDIITQSLKQNKTVPNHPLNIMEHLQTLIFNIDDSSSFFVLPLVPSESPSQKSFFSKFNKASQKSNDSIINHFNLIIDVIRRRIVKETVQIHVFNAQRLLRLLQTSKYNKESIVPLRSFDEPLLDPIVATWIFDPDLGFEARGNASTVKNLDLPYLISIVCPKEILCPASIQVAHKDQLILLVEDTIRARCLVKILIQKLFDNQLIESFVFEMRITCLLSQMESRGMMVDLQSIRKPKQVIEKRLRELNLEAEKLCQRPVLLTSPTQVSEYLYKGLDTLIPSFRAGKKAKMTTAKRHASTNHYSLMEISRALEQAQKTDTVNHKLCKVLLEHRPARTMLSFFESVEQHVIQPKTPPTASLGTKPKSHDDIMNVPRIHSKWFQCNTVTGRITSASPNMQQQPTADEIKHLTETDGDDEEGQDGSQLEDVEQNEENEQQNLSHATHQPQHSIDFKVNVRDAFVSRNGYRLVGADYSQIEMRILAEFSQDSQLINFFKSGQDIHRQVASKVFEMKLEEVTSQQREWCKRIVYGLVYGMGPPALADSLKISLAKAKAFIDTFMGSFPTLRDWLITAKNQVVSQKEVRTMLNRRRLFIQNSVDAGYGGDGGRHVRQGVNTMIQGSAADIVKLAAVRIERACIAQKITAYLLIQIHDELIYEVKEEHVQQFREIMKQAMEEAAPHFQVPLEVNIEEGRAWGSMK